MSANRTAMAAKKRKSSAKLKSQRAPVARSQRVNLSKSEALVRSAQAAWQRHQYETAISLYEQALRRDPRNSHLLVDMARAYGLRYRTQEAEQLLERAHTLHPRSAKVRSMIARSYSMINRPTLAIEHFEQALALGPQHSEADTNLIELATLYEQEHRLDAAREAVERALAIAPDRADALYRGAQLQIRAGEVAAGRSRLEHLTNRSDVAPQIRSDAWYEIGKLHDSAGDFDAAMRAFQSAKQLLEPRAERFQKECDFLRDRHRILLEALTPAHFRRWHDAGPAGKRRSIALLTGHPRSGTTLLEQVLDGHSQLVSADEYLVMGEFVFRPLAAGQPGNIPTPDGLDQIPAAALADLRDEYWQKTSGLLGEPIGDRMLLDKNPSLSYLLPVICRVFPEIHVLFALRDPRDVVISCYMQRLPINAIALNYLTLAGTAAKYADVMRYWLTIRPMLCCGWEEVRYEETVADLPKQARRTLKFLGLPWQENVVDFHTRAQGKRVRSPTYQAVTQPVYQHAIGRWKNYAKYMEPILKTLDPFLAAFDYR